MASSMRAFATAGTVGPVASCYAAARLLSTTSRKTLARPFATPAPTLKLANTGRIAFRRCYADEAPKPRPGKLRKTFKWIWRLTYLSVAGVLAGTAYIIYLDRNPDQQFEADPNKKTLVVLGT
jgi:NADH:ubiquinone reductase (non-electrogenic)